jgi:ABC-type polysaccharide/polyol phosphate transport system ATPase subunit
MKPENIIEVRDLSMLFRVYRSRRHSLRETLFRTFTRKDERLDIWALRDVSFEVKRGDALGVVGDNGSGKSTLCLILSKILTATSGQVELDGRVSALLALGTGFQYDLTGRDNIFLQCVYMGTKLPEVRSKFKEIVDFAELWDAIDLPVRTYSTGMMARLAFSIAASIHPEILILDELMGVGDLHFQEKSAARMKELVAQSKGLVVVSHSMDTIRSLCQRVIWLDRGRLVAEGGCEEVVSAYQKRCAS